MILNCFLHQTFNRYFTYIGNKEKKIRKIWPLKVYSNLKVQNIIHAIFYHVHIINKWSYSFSRSILN